MVADWVQSKSFEFSGGNARKLLALPGYALAAVCGVLVPRARDRWAFGSGIGVGEGALALARALREDDPHTHIVWLVADRREAESAARAGFAVAYRNKWTGFWATLRARYLVVTHGLGDVNRFGCFGGTIIHLGHGAPLKRLHLDASVTTRLRGPAWARSLLQRMYLVGSRQIALYVAGSVTAAERLRSAYRVAPGKVQVLGDPREDQLCLQAPEAVAAARAEVLRLAAPSLSPGDAGREHSEQAAAGDGAWGVDEPLVLYAPTWRDGAADPAEPSADEVQRVRATLTTLGARLLIRSHPLGRGSYDRLLGDRARLLGSDLVRDITPLLGAFDAVITDYSSIATSFALLERPIVWFASDLREYTVNRGLYEPLEVTAAGKVQHSWAQVCDRLAAVLPETGVHRAVAVADARALAKRFHDYPAGGAARRVLAAARRLVLSDAQRIQANAIFFESFYGRQVSCNPLALDREIARRFAELPRYWSVSSERLSVPPGAVPVLVGSPDWFAARRRARLLVVNDWLRHGFRRAKRQTVLQTWHGTMLKRLALQRAQQGVRARLAIRRESRRWSVLLSQNAHSTAQFRASYDFRGEILEVGYPRADRLAAAVVDGARISIAATTARRVLGIDPARRVLVYAPTWREGDRAGALLDVRELALELGSDWLVLTRWHTRSARVHASQLGGDAGVVDVSGHADVNDVILAADVLVTDYSSVMFDAAVARVPMVFFVPDLAEYRDRERGFTFDFEQTAPGPLVSTVTELAQVVRAGVPPGEAYERWCERYVVHDDGHVSERVVDALVARGALT